MGKITATAVCLLFAVFYTRSVSAVNKTWDGGGGDNNWNTGANWDANTAPSATDVLFFAGTVRLTPSNNFAANTQFNGITFNNGASSFTLSGNAINLAGDVTNNDNSLQTVNLALALTTSLQFNAASTGALSFGGAITSATAGTKTLTVTGGSGTTIGGVIGNGSGTIALNKTGTGTLTLNAANTYSGGTTSSAGQITIGNATALGTGGLSMTGGTLELNNLSISLANLSGIGGTIQESGNNNQDTLTVGSDNTSTSFGGAIIPGGNTNTSITLVKTGTGVLTLSGNNSSTKVAMTINSGVLRVNAANSLAGGNLTLAGGVLGLGSANFTASLGASNGAVQFTGSGGFAAYTAARNVNIGNAGGTMTWASTANFLTTGNSLILGASDADNTVTFQNPLALNGAARTIQVDDGTAAVDAILSAIVSGNSSSSLVKTGAGTLRVTAANSYGGATTINAGTLQSGAAAVIPDASAVTVGTGATWDLNSFNETVASIAGAGNITLGSATLIAGDSNTTTFSGVISGTGGALTKTGAGILRLNGANTYTANTSVNQGTLGGTGSVAGAVTVASGARLAPGASVGTFATGALTLGAGSFYDVELDAPGASDRTDVTGALALGGTLNLTDAGSAGAGHYTIFAQTGTPTGSFSAINNIANLHAKVDTATAGSVFLDVYRYAAANTVTTPINLGNVHVNDTFTSQALNIQNAAANDGFSETLNASFSGTTGSATGSGSFNQLAAGSTNNSSLTVGLTGTATAGAKTGTATVALASDGTGTSGYGATSLASQVITINGNVYRYAAPNTITTPVTLTNIHVGDSFGTSALTIQNTAANDGFSEKLNASFSAASGDASHNSGTVNLLAPGSSNNSSLVVGLAGANTATTGLKTGAATVALVSDGTGTSGLGNTTLISQTITINGGVYNLAATGFTGATLIFANYHVSDTVTAQALSIANTAPTGSYTEKLDAAFGSATGGVTGTGSISLLTPEAGASTGMSVGISTTTAGAKAGAIAVNFTSNGAGTSGLGNTSLGAQTVTVTGGNVYRLASANTITTPVTLANIHVGGVFGTQALTLQNTAANDGFSEKLNASFGALTGSASNNAGSVSLLAPVSSDNSSLTVGLANANTATAGAKTGTAVVALVSDGTGTSGLGTSTLTAQTITINGSVFNLAAANTISTLVSLGNVHVGGTFGTSSLTIQNTATAGAFTEGLNASFGTLTGNATTNAGSITNLAGGGSNSASLVVGLGGGAHTGTSGLKTGTAQINLVSNGTNSGLANTSLASQTVTINGTVWDFASPSFGSTTINLGNTHTGTAFGSQVLSLTNASGAFREAVAASFGSATGSATGSGSIASLAAGSTDNSSLSVAGLSTGSSGNKSGTIQVNLTSKAGGVGLSDTALTAQTINVSGAVYDYASPSFGATTINLGNIHAGASFGTQALSLSNASGAFREAVAASFGTPTAGITAGGSIASLAAGANNNSSLVVGISDNTAGNKSGTVAVNLTSKAGGAGLSDTSLTGQTITVQATVYTGQGVWNVNSNGSWNTAGNWTAAGGIPGVDGAFSAFDTATFGNVINNDRTISLNGVSPTLAGLTFNDSNDNYTIAQGSGGTLTLNSATVTVDDGNHTISAPVQRTGDLTVDIATGDQLTISGNLTGTGGLTKNGPGTLRFTQGNTNITLGHLAGNGGVIHYDPSTNAGATLTVGADNSNTTFAGNLTDAGSGQRDLALVKVGAGTLTLTGVTSHDGGTTISAGALKVSAASHPGDILNNAALIFDQATNATYANSVSGTGTVTKEGAGVLTFSTSNTYSGSTAINTGTLRLGTSGVLNDSTAVTVAGGATFDVNGKTETIGSLADSGDVTLGSGALTVGGGTTFSGVISGTGSLTKSGGGTLILAGDNTYTGATNITGGTLLLGAAERIANTSAVNISSGATFDINGFIETVASLTGNGTLLMNGGELIFNNTGSNSFNGNTTGNGQLKKQGNGVQTLNGTQAHTGPTTVAAGTLALGASASLPNSPTIQVDSGAILDVTGKGVAGLVLANGQTLKGNGTVTGNLTIGAGSTISPGNSPGLTPVIGDETWAGAGTYTWEIDDATGGAGSDPGWDLLNVTGTLNITATSGNPFTIDIDSLLHPSHLSGAAAGISLGTYNFMIAEAGTITGFAANKFLLDTTGFTNGPGSWTIYQQSQQVWLQLNFGSEVVSAVPEPTVLALLVSGGLLGLLRYRSRGRR